MSFDYAGNTLSTAKELNITAKTQTYTGSVSQFEPNDFYSVSFSGHSSFNLTLDGLDADANLQLIRDFNSNGLVDQGEVIASSYRSGTQAESIQIPLDAGTYFIQVNSWSDFTNYNLNLSAQPFDGFEQGVGSSQGADWFSQNLRDLETINKTRELFVDGQLSRTDMITIFRDAGDFGVIDGNELLDLRTIVNNAGGFNMQDHVRVLSNKVVNGDVANANFWGQPLGNLFEGSSSDHMERLIAKWFYGSDRPIVPSNYSYQQASGLLFQNGASYQDIKQGYVGDCYFLAGLAEVALRSSGAIESMFIDNGDNTYTVRFYNKGVADYVTVDRYLPTDSSGKFVYANVNGDYNNPYNELWVALAEKAYAQINESGWIGQDNTNSYLGIDAGWDTDAFSHITGLNAAYDNLDFNYMVNDFYSGNLLGLISNPYSHQVASNIVPGHVYTILNYDSSTQLFTLFNPWGEQGAYGTDGNYKSGYLQLSFAELQANFSHFSYITS